MAVLSSTERRKIMAQLVREFAWAGLTKPDVQAAVDAIDDYIDLNAASMNLALPQPFRNTATPSQKALLFAFVAARRGGYLRVEGD